jgi:hypothetical protein
VFLFEHWVANRPMYERAFAFDLEVPPSFTPRNEDGEVAQFALLSPQTVIDWIEQDRFSLDPGITSLDWCIRVAGFQHAAVQERIDLLKLR